MNKENLPPDPTLLKPITDEQRARISQNFRAAKALLARKRPFEFASPVPLSRCIKTNGSSPRTPLAEIRNGTHLHGQFLTPVKSEPVSSILDEELDDDFLKEVELLEKSSLKKEKVAHEFGEVDDTENTLSTTKKENVDTVPVSEVAEECGVVPRKYYEYLEKLNDAQREAACYDITVPLMIVAGPGSGKTSTMVGRVLTLLKEGIEAKNILAMTFTTAAASEMRDRIGAVVGKSIAKELVISTFHSFCLQLCRSHAEKLDRTSEFQIYGHGQQRKAVMEALRLMEEGKNGQESDSKVDANFAYSFKEKSKKWQKFVAQAKASGKTPEQCRKNGDETGAVILEHYHSILKSCNALDYHDFISCSVKLLTDFPEVYKECLNTWKSIVVDEFQDTSSMQYLLLKMLASHNHITIVGDEDQSIFSFNGADASGFDSFRRDFPIHKEVKLQKNYRSTRFIVEAASSLIHHNVRRCQLKQVETDNCAGNKIVIKECHTEDAQCAFVVDKILEITSDSLVDKCSFNDIAILYRRQVSGKAFQMSFRNRKIPFNVHGVAFYRKKIIKAVISMLQTTVPGCGDNSFRQAFKSLYPGEKEEKKKVIEYVEKISNIRNCSFSSSATDIFGAKISGTFKRAQLTQGRRVLSTLEMLAKLVKRETSISVVISFAANMLPQKYLFEQRAVVDADGGKLLNEDNDIRSVLQYLLDDVSDFLTTHINNIENVDGTNEKEQGCSRMLKAFIDYLTLRETENFRCRRHDNQHSVTLTTIHQSKGLEWDTVFIVKTNDTEIPLLHEYNGAVKTTAAALEEERRLLYVAMTRAKKKLYILYVTVDSNWQLLQPSRFLREIPNHLTEIQGDVNVNAKEDLSGKKIDIVLDTPRKDSALLAAQKNSMDEMNRVAFGSEDIELVDASIGNNFLKRFNVDERAIVSHLFHQWAKKPAFHLPKRLLDKVSFVIDERLRNKTYKHKDVLRALKSCLGEDEAIQYAQYVLKWEQIPSEQRAHLMREKQEHFQKLRIENSMGSSEATPKQISYLQTLGCTITPTSRLHASRLIEQYKSL